jgi:hypothetical protein
MRASQMLAAHYDPEKGTIFIKALHDRVIYFLGSNLESSAQTWALTNQTVTSLSIIPPKMGRQGLIALVVSSQSKNPEKVDFFLPVYCKNDKPFVDLENDWQPSAKRLLQITGHYYLHTAIASKIFTTYTYCNKSNECHVDGNLLCKYAMMEVDAAHIIAAARAPKQEEWVKKKLEQVTKAFNVARNEAEVKIRSLENEIIQLKEKHWTQVLEVAKIMGEIAVIIDQAWFTKDANDKLFQVAITLGGNEMVEHYKRCVKHQRS